MLVETRREFYRNRIESNFRSKRDLTRKGLISTSVFTGGTTSVILAGTSIFVFNPDRR